MARSLRRCRVDDWLVRAWLDTEGSVGGMCACVCANSPVSSDGRTVDTCHRTTHRSLRDVFCVFVARPRCLLTVIFEAP